jgi:hypothetical protein
VTQSTCAELSALTLASCASFQPSHQSRPPPRLHLPWRLAFIDETSVSTNMTRRYGRARGTRLVCKIPHGHWKTSSFVAALRYERLTAPLLLDGPTNVASFLAYVEQILAPTLRRGDMVIMDNVSDKGGDHDKLLHR